MSVALAQMQANTAMARMSSTDVVQMKSHSMCPTRRADANIAMLRQISRAPERTPMKPRYGCRLEFIGAAILLVKMMLDELIEILEFSQCEEKSSKK